MSTIGKGALIKASDLLMRYNSFMCSLSVAESLSLWPSLSSFTDSSTGVMVGWSLEEKAKAS